MSLLPNAEHEMARRLVRAESRPRVMVWRPCESASGRWEAAGDGWEIADSSLATFMNRLEGQLAKLDQRAQQADE